MITKIDKLDEVLVKYLFIDIEVLNEKGIFPEPKEALYPVSCITIYNSLYKNIQTWWLKDFKNEEEMLESFIEYVKSEKPDILLAWNVNFDYNYLYNRVPNFARRISPIGRGRFQSRQELFYPTGISIVDYLGLFRKVFKAEQSYKLDDIAQKHLKEETWGDTEFGLTEHVRDKNINDVKRLVKLEEKYRLMPYYDEIRRLSKCQWEDLYYNSRIVECLLLEEAKVKNIVLPSRHDKTTEKVKFKGATREAAENGVIYEVGKFDLGSAYPSMIYNFCLDTMNKNDSKEGIEINGIYYKQNEDALLPSAIKKILTIKDNLKKAKKIDPSLDSQYEAIKSIVNSCYGVMGSEYFRLYDTDIAASTTYLVRDLLMYCKDKLEEKGHRIVYWDTDSLFLKGKEDISDYLNELIQDWGKKYGKEKIDLFFGYEGFFESLFILGKCHYYGYIYGKKEPEIKGVEIKRSSSSKYEAYFQRELLEKVINKQTQENILDWVENERERIKTLPVEEIAFPCKISGKKYKTTVTRKDGKTFSKKPPIFVRAYENTQKLLSDFKLEIGELFYYIYVNPLTVNCDVLALTKTDKDFITWKENINWKEMIRRNIISKTKLVFEAMKWDIDISETDNKQLKFKF